MGTFQRLWSPSRRVLEVLAGIGKEIQESKRIRVVIVVDILFASIQSVCLVIYSIFLQIMLFALEANLAVPKVYDNGRCEIEA